LHWDRQGEVRAEVNVKFTDRATVSDMNAQHLASYHLASTYETPVMSTTSLYTGNMVKLLPSIKKDQNIAKKTTDL